MFLLRLEQTINAFSDWLGKISAVLFVIMLFNVFYDVITRYLFNDVSIGMQELEWHLFAAMFMLGVPFTLRVGGHVRVDLIYEGLSLKKKAWIDLFGVLTLLFPFCLLVAWYGVDFARESFELGEGSGDPGGLPYRWVIKAVIPFAFFCTFISGVGMMLHSVNTLAGHHRDDGYTPMQH
ncbi:C4-dicarboxylate ABC transporter [Marinobacterium iners]|jgi:TRAP-type mannitol/chloroaromatic compound transport system permease small subunit|uniref:TRAP transporter small permease protein n=1 Tax=Marinobacterium iners DSM 11526 TaxID=1122198 RepID=A0A1H4A0L3_9GAMM|nr:TRAP transporter small permease subunit [Marinobacterium iners]QSR35507.1 C4-dicarboxylate ABC transporter [Marinobacterium iners]SEA29693.1 TRAP-type mannitol/chloroaromatic compound transport system, small permease component [Marinobacterium iners DSM 11526]